MATSNDIKNGSVLNLESQLWSVLEFQHVKPGKGPAFVRTKIKNVMTGKIVDKTFNAGVKLDFETVDRRDMQYLYHDGTSFIFMDPDSFDQIPVTPEIMGDAPKYLLENEKATIGSHNGNPIFVELPASVVLTVTETEPGLQGDRSSGGTKPATVETGLEIQVPLFLDEGTKVKIDTRTGDYISRVND